MQLGIRHFKLPLKHRFTISRESYAVQDTLIVSLTYKGKTGYGETTANPYYNASIPSLKREIETVRREIENSEFQNPKQFETLLEESGIGNFSRCALDMAAHDLHGKLQGEPLYKLWGTEMNHYPVTNYTIGLATIDEMVEKMKEFPWPVYKIKLGTPDDLDIIKTLRDHTDAVFRIDANCAWEPEQTVTLSGHFKNLGVEFIEQPLPAGDWEGMEHIKTHSALPVIADESCEKEGDVLKCAAVFHGINIKLTKCGGISPALRMIKKGRECGLRIMMGCMTESSAGISAVAQFLPQLDYVDMDGALLLAEDIATGVEIGPGGKVTIPDTGGTGVKMLQWP